MRVPGANAVFHDRSAVLVTTNLNPAGRPVVDSPADAPVGFRPAPVVTLVLGSHLVFRGGGTVSE